MVVEGEAADLPLRGRNPLAGQLFNGSLMPQMLALCSVCTSAVRRSTSTVWDSVHVSASPPSYDPGGFIGTAESATAKRLSTCSLAVRTGGRFCLALAQRGRSRS